MLFPLIGVLAAYLIGSIPFGFLVARARGVDIFKAGSGNIGATNIGRVLGRKFGLLVFFCDVLKGAIPTFLGLRLFDDSRWAVAIGLAAIIGHMFPIFLRFRGGKGVATGFGVVAVLLPFPAALAFGVWFAVLLATRTVSLASIVAAITLAFARCASVAVPFDEANAPLSAFSILTAAIVVIKHRANIVRLWNGAENRVADSPRNQMTTRIVHVLALSLWFGGGMFFSFVAAPSLFATFDSHTAGQAVGPMFPLYFAIQGACGLLALATAAAWARIGKLHAWRFAIVTAAVGLVLAGWPLVGKVAELRAARESADAVVAATAREAFGMWHGISLMLNMATLALVGAAVALMAVLPDRGPRITDAHDSL